MKIIIIVLWFCAAVGLAVGISGVKRYRYSSSTGAEVTRYDSAGRVCVLAFGASSLAAAFGCWKRRKFGWYLTFAMMGTAVGITLWGMIVILAASWSSIPTAIVWLVQAAAVGYLMKWWFTQRRLFTDFQKPNQSSQPTPSGRG